MILISEYEKPSGVDQKTVEAYYVVSSEADILVSVQKMTFLQSSMTPVIRSI